MRQSEPASRLQDIKRVKGRVCSFTRWSTLHTYCRARVPCVVARLVIVFTIRSVKTNLGNEDRIVIDGYALFASHIPSARAGGNAMELRQLRTFAMVAELENFARAAEAMEVTQPAVSQHVAALEHELGVSLFRCRGRSIKLTELL